MAKVFHRYHLSDLRWRKHAARHYDVRGQQLSSDFGLDADALGRT
ncbi:MAG: hypothetical protein JWN41_1001, partial [Thermoleophilia bacterium]|nr:hypothetical protein [Thermoleophilia bacterium]